MNLYVMRHGTTVWNEKGISQGRSQNRLSKTGKIITEQMAKKYRDIGFDIIVCSPLFRTVQTANIMNKYHNVKKIKDERIIEIDQGIFTGKKVSTLTEQQKRDRILRSPNCKMESVENIYKRTKNFVENIKKDYQYNNVLVVTHNWIASLIENIITKQNFDYHDRKNLNMFDNAEIKVFEL